MKHLINHSLPRRCGALLLAALILLGSLGALPAARAAALPVMFSLVWNEGSAVSAPITAPGYENSHWLYASPEALTADARLTGSDMSGQFARFALSTGAELTPEGVPLSQLGYTDAGLDLNGSWLDVYGFDAAGQMTGSFRLYISVQTDTPALPALQPVEVSIPVRYMNAMNGQVLYETSAPVRSGAEGNWVSADPGLVPGYDLASDGSIFVQVDDSGVCTPAAVEFHFTQQVQPAEVTVICLDQKGIELSRATQTCAPGPFTLTAPALDGYDLASEPQVSGEVTADGANPAVVEFHYNKQVLPVTLPVACLDEKGTAFSTYTQECAPGMTT